MKKLRSPFTYANVIATLALFLTLGGGVVWAAGGLGKDAVKSKNIARNAVKNRNIAPNAVKARNLGKSSVTAGKVKNGSLTRTQLQAGTLAGLQVADAQATNVPGLATSTTSNSGTPIPLTGTASFVPEAGKSYVLLTELRGNPTDADGANQSGYGGPSCYAFVRVSVNGVPLSGVEISANANATPPYDVNPVGTASTAVGLLEAGQAQTISAAAIGNSGCGSATTGNLRIVVVQLG